MLTIRYLYLLVMFLSFSGCAVKGYVGADDLPKTQLATVAFKAPVISKIPLFWIPPFNMLTWLADDWFETSWGSGKVTVTNRPGTTTTVLWNRLEEILVNPIQQELNSKKIHEINRQITGSESCSTNICTCTETESKKKDGDKESKKEKKCQQTKTCKTPVLITNQDWLCRLPFDAKANQRYEVFVRDKILMLSTGNKQSEQAAICGWGATYSYPGFNETSITESCYR